MEIKAVGVVGCGLMGVGIAELCARAGYTTVVHEASKELLHNGLERVGASLRRAQLKGKLTPEQCEAALSLLSGAEQLEELAGCQIIIEAISEHEVRKVQLFQKLDAALPATVVFATNTSSISLTRLASVTHRVDRVAGLHFFNPAPVMPLVEVVPTLATDPEVIEVLRNFVQRLGKQPIVVKDRPGFLVNALLTPYMVDAVRMVESGYASEEEVDQAMRLGAGYPMGPLTLLDLVGLDTFCSLCDILYAEFKDPRYAAPALLRQMVMLGWLGRKSGRGFYRYDETKATDTRRGVL